MAGQQHFELINIGNTPTQVSFKSIKLSLPTIASYLWNKDSIEPSFLAFRATNKLTKECIDAYLNKANCPIPRWTETPEMRRRSLGLLGHFLQLQEESADLRWQKMGARATFGLVFLTFFGGIVIGASEAGSDRSIKEVPTGLVLMLAAIFLPMTFFLVARSIGCLRKRFLCGPPACYRTPKFINLTSKGQEIFINAAILFRPLLSERQSSSSADLQAGVARLLRANETDIQNLMAGHLLNPRQASTERTPLMQDVDL
jgi:hypothetical protein